MADGPKFPKSVLEQFQQMQQDLIAAQAELAKMTVSGSAGDGAVTITVTGDQRCTVVEIDPEVLKDGDVEAMQHMVLAAFNQALDASRKLAADTLGPLSVGMDL